MTIPTTDLQSAVEPVPPRSNPVPRSGPALDGASSRSSAALEEVQKLEEQLAARRKDAAEGLKAERRELNARIVEVDREIARLTGEPKKTAAKRICRKCGSEGHNARTCPNPA